MPLGKWGLPVHDDVSLPPLFLASVVEHRDVARVWLSRKFSLSVRQLVLSVLIDRIFAVGALIVLAAVTFVYLTDRPADARWLADDQRPSPALKPHPPEEIEILDEPASAAVGANAPSSRLTRGPVGRRIPRSAWCCSGRGLPIGPGGSRPGS